MNEQLETRMAVIETLTEQHREERAIMRSDLKQIKESVHNIETRLASVHWCPKPGTCIQVESQLGHQEDRIRLLEDFRTETRSSYKTLVAIAVFISGLSAVICSWLL